MVVAEIETIQRQLIDDRTAAELKWFWFRAALSSYKRDFLLRPFPPAFKKFDGLNVAGASHSLGTDLDGKDFERLTAAAVSMPRLSTLPIGDRELSRRLTDDQRHLLTWVFDAAKSYDLQTLSKDYYEEIKKLTGQTQTNQVPEPDYVFRVEYDAESENRFLARRGERRSLFAYHGSRVSNFYSIVRHGLRASFNKVAVFGEGTYLSPELSVSLNWSPLSGHGFAAPPADPEVSPNASASSFEGARLSCVAICEIIDDTTDGLYRCENQDTNNDTTKRRKNVVPERYYLVRNDDLVRIRYILTYVDGSTVSNSAVENARRGTNFCDRLGAFCSRHYFWLIMAAYVLLLGAVGLANSRDFQWYIRRLWTTASSDGYGYTDGAYAADNYHHGYDEK